MWLPEGNRRKSYQLGFARTRKAAENQFLEVPKKPNSQSSGFPSVPAYDTKKRGTPSPFPPQIFGSFWMKRNCTFCGDETISCWMVEETGEGRDRRDVARAGVRSSWELRGDIFRIFAWAVSSSD